MLSQPTRSVRGKARRTAVAAPAASATGIRERGRWREVGAEPEQPRQPLRGERRQQGDDDRCSPGYLPSCCGGCGRLSSPSSSAVATA